MTHEFELQDARIIQRHEQLEVLSVRCEVMWPDGSAITLHPVQDRGAAAQMLRAAHIEGQWHIVHLSKLSPRLAREVAIAPARDVPGTLIYGLRGAYMRAADCLKVIQSAALAHWPGEARHDRPARRRSDCAHPAHAPAA